MKKLFLVILSVSLIFGLLYGCNKKEELEPQPSNSQTPIVSAVIPTTAPTSEPAATPIVLSIKPSENYITPEELNSIVEGTGGGYDFTVSFDSSKWVQVDDKNTFVMKFDRVDEAFPWTATTINNAFITTTLRDSQYDYIVMKFMKSNTETLIVFEAVNEDGVVGSSLGDAPDGVNFAVAIGN